MYYRIYVPYLCVALLSALYRGVDVEQFKCPETPSYSTNTANKIVSVKIS